MEDTMKELYEGAALSNLCKRGLFLWSNLRNFPKH